MLIKEEGACHDTELLRSWHQSTVMVDRSACDNILRTRVDRQPAVDKDLILSLLHAFFTSDMFLHTESSGETPKSRNLRRFWPPFQNTAKGRPECVLRSVKPAQVCKQPLKPSTRGPRSPKVLNPWGPKFPAALDWRRSKPTFPGRFLEILEEAPLPPGVYGRDLGKI